MSSTHTSTSGDPGHGPAHEPDLAHVAEPRVLIVTFVALIILTAITVTVATVGLGEFDFVFAMVIATIKALLVCLFFMHLRYDKPFHALLFVASVSFAILFIGFAYMDTDQYQKVLETKDAKPLSTGEHGAAGAAGGAAGPAASGAGAPGAHGAEAGKPAGPGGAAPQEGAANKPPAGTGGHE